MSITNAAFVLLQNTILAVSPACDSGSCTFHIRGCLCFVLQNRQSTESCRVMSARNLLGAFLESFCFLGSQALKYNWLLAPAPGKCGSARGAGGGEVWEPIPPGSATQAPLEDRPFPKHFVSQIVQRFLTHSIACQRASCCPGVLGCAWGAWPRLWSQVCGWWLLLWLS